MNSIVATYPGFRALPRGIKQLLVTSESAFFIEAKPAAENVALGKLGQRAFQRPRVVAAEANQAGAWRN